jgi:hypothetical protein
MGLSIIADLRLHPSAGSGQGLQIKRIRIEYRIQYPEFRQ